MQNKIEYEVERLLQFALKHKMIYQPDYIPARNALMELLQIEEPYSGPLSVGKENFTDSPSEILNDILDYAAWKKIIPENTVTYRDLLRR